MAAHETAFVDAAPHMVDGSAALTMPGAAPAAIARQGYLYLRGAVDPDAIAWVRREMTEALMEEGHYAPAPMSSGATDATPRWTGLRAEGVGIPGRRAQAAFKKRHIWERFVEMPGVRDVFEAVAGGPVTFLPISEYRTAAPGSRTAVHQDGAANYGYDIYTAWFPAMPVDADLGGLALLPKEPGKPYPPLQETGALPPELASDPGWLCAAYKPGDMVVFDGSVVHCGLLNRTPDTLRLSFEIRFQGPSAPRPMIGTIAAISLDAVTIEEEDGTQTSFTIDDDTRLRGDRLRSTALIPRAQLPGSDLVVGFPVIVGHENGRAISVRGIF